MRGLVALGAVVIGWVLACSSSKSDEGGGAGEAGDAGSATDAGSAGAGRGGAAGASSGAGGAGKAGAGGAGKAGAGGSAVGGAAGTSGGGGAGKGGTAGSGGKSAAGAAGSGGASGAGAGGAAGSAATAGTMNAGGTPSGGGEGGEGGAPPGPLTCSAAFIQAQAEALVASFEEPTVLCTEPRMTGLGLSSGAYLVTACSAAACEGDEIGCGSEISWSEPPYLEADGGSWLARGTFDHDFSCTVHFERSDELVCDCAQTGPVTGKTFRAPFSAAGSGTTLSFVGESVSFSSGTYQMSMACSGDVIDDDGVDGCNVDSTQIGGAASGECYDSLTDTHLGPFADRWFEHVTSFTADCSDE
jgi:hypothetical protein